MARQRKSTVEPVLGTLINFLNMRRVNTRGIELANKHVLMAAICYNLKKYLKFITRKSVSNAMAMQFAFQSVFCAYLRLFSAVLSHYCQKLEINQVQNKLAPKTLL